MDNTALSQKLISTFKPTHVLITSGMEYEKLDVIRFKFNDEWMDGVLYRNREGQLFCRPAISFEQAFKEF